MNNYPTLVKERLMSLISEMSETMGAFVKNPGKDFTRNRKLPFEAVVKLLISMGGNSIYKELLDAQGYDVNTATTSAFVQQRDKILPYAFEFLLRTFTKSHYSTSQNIEKYSDYQLLAADGSDLHIATNPNDPSSYYKTAPHAKGYNLLHINTLYDLCNKLYIDALVQPRRAINEGRALADMINRSAVADKTIIIADRNYESYNVFANIENRGLNYLIRIKDLGSNGILSALPVELLPQPDDEFDICINRIITRSRNKKVIANPHLYRRLAHNSPFDFLDNQNIYYPINLRVVRIKIADDSYETLVTNLPPEAFPSSELKKLYAMRWGIETSFRELKYSVGLNNLHAKKREYIVQEIFARIIMYNFAQMITSHVVIEKADTKHIYQVNFTTAILVCRFFLQLNIPPPDIEALIRKSILPIRLGRTSKRKRYPKTMTSFVYRVA